MNKLKKFMKYKWFIFGVILVIAVFIVLLSSGKEIIIEKRGLGNVLYKKDGKIYTANLVNGEKTEIMKFEKAPKTMSEENAINRILNSMYLSAEGDVIYSDTIDNSSKGFDIYYRKAGDETKLIDTDVRAYSVSADIKKITYIKGDENALYLKDEKTNELIASDVVTASLSEDGKKLIYYTYSGDIYAKTEGEAPKLIAENCILQLLTEKADKVYYLKDGKLYLWQWESEPVLLKEGVKKLVAAGKLGDFCYITEVKENLSYYDMLIKEEYSISKLSDEYIEKLKEAKKEFTFYHLYYSYNENDTLLSERYLYTEGSSGAIIGDYLREEQERINFEYKIIKDVRNNIAIRENDSIEYINKKLYMNYGGKKKFEAILPVSLEEKAILEGNTVKLPDGSEYYMRIGGEYRNLYYKEAAHKEQKLMDILVGFLSVNEAGEVWYLKGYAGEKLELYSYYNGKRRNIENGIEIISYISNSRSREFYSFVKGYGGRVSYAIQDNSKYMDVYISDDLPWGMGICGNSL